MSGLTEAAGLASGNPTGLNDKQLALFEKLRPLKIGGYARLEEWIVVHWARRGNQIAQYLGADEKRAFFAAHSVADLSVTSAVGARILFSGINGMKRLALEMYRHNMPQATDQELMAAIEKEVEDFDLLELHQVINKVRGDQGDDQGNE